MLFTDLYRSTYKSVFQHSDLQTDPKLYFWDIETDSLSYFNFDSGKGEQDDYPPEQMEGMLSGSAIEMSDADRSVSENNVYLCCSWLLSVVIVKSYCEIIQLTCNTLIQ